VELSWTSSASDIINEEGKYNPAGLMVDSTVTLVGRLDCGNYYWSQTYTVKAKAETMPSGDYSSGMVAYYGFDGQPLFNSFNTDQRAYLRASTGGTTPILLSDHERLGQFVHQYEGANGKNSYVQFVNPFYEGSIGDGITLSFWLKRNTDDLVNDIFCFYNYNPVKRFFMTGNSYFGYADNVGNWFDINNPESRKLSSQIPVGAWNHIVVTISRTDGIKLYVNRSSKTSMAYTGELDGVMVNTKAKCDFNLILDHIPACRNFYFGYGMKEGSADICIDDLMMFDRVLSYEDVSALYAMETRVFDFNQLALGIDPLMDYTQQPMGDKRVYNLQGQRVITPTKGIYIQNGKKYVYK
jgi:arabinan endo-1,5-alpha-L-arabinosidase